MVTLACGPEIVKCGQLYLSEVQHLAHTAQDERDLLALEIEKEAWEAHLAELGDLLAEEQAWEDSIDNLWGLTPEERAQALGLRLVDLVDAA